MVKESMYTPQTLHRRLIWGVGQGGEGNVQTYRLPFYGFRPRLKVTGRTKKDKICHLLPRYANVFIYPVCNPYTIPLAISLF